MKTTKFKVTGMTCAACQANVEKAACKLYGTESAKVNLLKEQLIVNFDETKLNGCFTSVLLNSDYGKRQMREQIKTSAGQYTISQDGIGAIMAILPPMELQNQFATFVEQTDKSKLAIQQSLDKLELLKKSLMQEYFG